MDAHYNISLCDKFEYSSLIICMLLGTLILQNGIILKDELVPIKNWLD